MRARKVYEAIEFEKEQDPKRSMRIGKGRFRKPGDEEIIPGIVSRKPEDNGPYILLVNLDNGKEISVGLYAAREVIGALKELFADES